MTGQAARDQISAVRDDGRGLGPAAVGGRLPVRSAPGEDAVIEREAPGG